jgi:hypothetical protein
MKNILLISSFLIPFIFSSATRAQQQNSVMRMTACSLNPGYSMDEAVAIARDFPWSDNAPSGVFWREPIAYTGNNTPTWDFLSVAYFNGYADMIENLSAFRNRDIGRNGITFRDFASCNPLVRILDAHPANPGDIFDDTESTIMTSFSCTLNGETTAQDAVAVVRGMGNNLDVSSQVTTRRYGGPPIAGGNQIGMSFVYSDANDFGETLDLIASGEISPNTGLGGGNPMTCNNGSMYITHRIYGGDN